MWNYIARILVTVIIAYLFRQKPDKPKAATLDDFDFPTVEEGTECGRVFGTAWITSPNIHWYGDFKVQPKRKKGGKK